VAARFLLSVLTSLLLGFLARDFFRHSASGFFFSPNAGFYFNSHLRFSFRLRSNFVFGNFARRFSFHTLALQRLCCLPESFLFNSQLFFSAR
jgi:hypothetical protein